MVICLIPPGRYTATVIEPGVTRCDPVDDETDLVVEACNQLDIYQEDDDE